MAKNKQVYECQECGYQSPKWMGRCSDCGNWNSMIETTKIAEPKNERQKGWLPASQGKAQKITEVQATTEARSKVGIDELDRVLGGGIVKGSFTLIGGDPGIGKSTLLLQAVGKLADRGDRVLYVSGEESSQQVKLRGERLGVSSDNLYLLAESCLDIIQERIKEVQPDYLIIDSIQSIFTSAIESTPGSLSQVRECSGRIMHLAKSGLSTFMIGHVTKEGAIAGPQTISHIVDTTLLMEGDSSHPYRILRATKNRFGSTNELGIFSHTDGGLIEVPDPSEIFLQERPQDAAGSVVVPSMEGTRPILVEIQALVSTSPLGTPRRTCMGVDSQRTSLLCAVLEKKVEMSLAGLDIFVNVASGVMIKKDPAADLGVLAALASSHMGKVVEERTILFGEVGLAGEVRAVSNVEARVNEAARLGFNRCIMPAGNLKNCKAPKGIELIGVRTASEAIDNLLC